MSDWNADKVKQLVEKNKVIIFGKGTKMQPMCGFTARAMEILVRCGKPFEAVNIFEDEGIRPALISFTSWPTTPQIFVNGEFLGGGDTIAEMYESGELQQKMDAAFASA